MNILGDLLRIKEFRQDKAELEVSRARSELERATAALHEAREALEACRADCETRERALYTDLCSRVVRLADLDDVKLAVQLMQGEIHGHEEKVEQAEEARKSATEQLAQARRDYQEATRNREKFFELESQDQAERLLEAGRVEDIEMEEVAARKPAVEAETDTEAEAANDPQVEAAA